MQELCVNGEGVQDLRVLRGRGSIVSQWTLQEHILHGGRFHKLTGGQRAVED